MKPIIYSILMLAVFAACTKKTYSGNGQKIYRTGTNLAGEALLDKRKSQITFIRSCQACHGKTGTRNPDCSIRYADLSDAQKVPLPYTPELFFRFLDEDLKSDGSVARTGVHWKMSVQDKTDLLNYLKTL